MTRYEFSLAWLLFAQPGVCISRQQIASTVWGCAEEIVARPLEQHIYRLRKKLQLNGKSGLVLRTVYGRGYALEVQNQPSCVAPNGPPTGIGERDPAASGLKTDILRAGEMAFSCESAAVA
jgi:DNA-binding winged helix-turn-helix (wHTH) protein